MKRVLVTGATGFIGSYVVRELLARGITVIATSVNAARAATHEWFSLVNYVPFDLRAFDGTEDLFQKFLKPDLAIHLAWEGLPNYKAPFHLEENVPRHFTFLRNLIHHGIGDLTVTGTCFEYGLREGELSEEMTPMPSNSYAAAKERLRELLMELSANESFRFRWVRLFYMYGKGQSPNSLLSQLQSALDRGDEVFNMSPGDQLRDYLKVEDVAKYIVSIALQNKELGIINCCSGEPISVIRLVEDYLQQHNRHIKLNRGFYPYSDIEPRDFWGNNTKLKKILKDGQ